MVPRALRTWFVIHFAADMAFGVPLLIAPATVMRLFGWEVVDPFTARLVGAALLGIGGAALLGRITGWATATPLSAVVLAVGFSAVVGVFFGYYPARKAASLNPIEALRYE